MKIKKSLLSNYTLFFGNQAVELSACSHHHMSRFETGNSRTLLALSMNITEKDSCLQET